MLGRKRKLLKKQHKLDVVSKKQQKENKFNPMMEEIPSDAESLQEGVADFDMEEVQELDEETADQKRIRLAKQILKTTKSQIRQNQNDDNFFLQEEKIPDDDADYIPVIRDDLVTKKLHEQILAKKQQIFHLYADQLKKQFEKCEILTLKGHKKCITCLEIDPTSSFLYSASKDSSIIKWNLKTLQKTFISLGKAKDPTGHYDEILCMSLNFDGKYLVTAGKDRMIKLWNPLEVTLLHTFKGHKDTIQGIKFGINTNQFCSISNDRTFKIWDATEKAYLETLYGHKSEVNSIDAQTGENFISSGYDKSVIIWKTEHQTQLIYEEGHEYSIDSVKCINHDHFITGSQDGSIGIWAINKKKPILKINNPHGDNWITAIGNFYNTDVFASASYNGMVKVYKAEFEKRKYECLFSIPHNGIVNDIKFSSDTQIMAFCEGEEHKFGRWITRKAKNCIKIVKF